MKTYPKQRIGSRAYIGESMVKILICDDDSTFAQSMFKRILSLPAYRHLELCGISLTTFKYNLICRTTAKEKSRRTADNLTRLF